MSQSTFRCQPLAVLALLISFLTSTHALSESTTCPISRERSYIVKAGDNLSLIGVRCFGSSKQGLALGRINKVRKPNALAVGKSLKVPEDWEVIDAKTSAQFELNYWRKHFHLAPMTGEDGKRAITPSRPPLPPVSEAKSSKEMAALQSAQLKKPEAALQDTRKLLKEETTLVSARISEIKLLIKSGKKSEAELRARALISAHPELGELKKIREWANLPMEQDPNAVKKSEEFAQ